VTMAEGRIIQDPRCGQNRDGGGYQKGRIAALAMKFPPDRTLRIGDWKHKFKEEKRPTRFGAEPQKRGSTIS